MKLRRYIAAFLAAGMLLTGCGARPRYHYDVRQDLGIYFTNADAVIESIRQAMKRRDWRITITYTSHKDNMEVLGTIVRELMTCALAETDDPLEGDYLLQQYGGYEMNFSYTTEEDEYHYEIAVYPNYYTTPAQEEQVTARLTEVYDSFAFDKNTTDYEKIRTIYDYVCANVRYDEVHAKNPNHHLKTTAYAALMQHTAVCQGYAVLLYRMLRENGISSRIVTGTAMRGEREEAHAWNLIELDGVYYNADATLDASGGTHDYFLKSDADMTYHKRDAAYADEAFRAGYPTASQSYDFP